MTQERLIEDPLFLACTRPAMVLGAPMEAMGVNVILTGLAFLIGGSLLYLGIAVGLHLIFRAVCKADHNAFRLLFLHLDTKGRARNQKLWGGSSASPLPVVRRFSLQALRHG